MSYMEQLVRPFVAVPTIATRRIVAKNKAVTKGTAIIRWGSAGAMPTATQRTVDSSGVNFSIECCKDTYSEHERNTDLVRVENPDDPTQFVMVRRIKDITFGKKSEECYDPFTDVGVRSALAEIDASVAPIFAATDNGGCKAKYSLTNG